MKAWVEKHPITDKSFSRESIIPSLIENPSAAKLGLTEAIADLAEEVNNLSVRLSLYNKCLPNQIRWQAEFLVDDLVGDLDIESALAKVSYLSQTIEGAALVAGQAPDIIARERLAALAALHQERLETMDSLEELLVGTQH